MSDQSNELFREVSASLKNDKIKEFFQKNSKLITISATILIILLAIYAFLVISQKNANKKYSKPIQNAITKQKVGAIQDSKKDLQEVFYDEKTPDRLKAIAGFRLAAIYLSEDDKQNIKKIINIYEIINNCKKCDIYSKDLAGMLLVKFNITNNEEDSYEDLIAKIKKIENSSINYRYEIALDRAFYELENNHIEEAKKVFEFIVNSPEAKVDVKERANNGLKIILAKEI